MALWLIEWRRGDGTPRPGPRSILTWPVVIAERRTEEAARDLYDLYALAIEEMPRKVGSFVRLRRDGEVVAEWEFSELDQQAQEVPGMTIPYRDSGAAVLQDYAADPEGAEQLLEQIAALVSGADLSGPDLLDRDRFLALAMGATAATNHLAGDWTGSLTLERRGGLAIQVCDALRKELPEDPALRLQVLATALLFEHIKQLVEARPAREGVS